MRHFLQLAVILLACCALPTRARRQLAQAPAPGPEAGFSCPPPGFDAVQEFNVTEYISAPWFVLAQTPLIYQPVSQLYCTRAEYVPLNPADPLEGLTVINYSNQGAVNGPAVSTGGGGPTLLATVPDLSRPSKLSVGFDFPGASQLVGTQFGAGPYWVIATGEDGQGGYGWAIVSGGAPTVPTPGGCAFAEDGTTGLWLFSRTTDAPAALDSMFDALQGLGVDTAALVEVEQEGCLYEGA